jgi:hypothetical protein
VGETFLIVFVFLKSLNGSAGGVCYRRGEKRTDTSPSPAIADNVKLGRKATASTAAPHPF